MKTKLFNITGGGHHVIGPEEGVSPIGGQRTITIDGQEPKLIDGGRAILGGQKIFDDPRAGKMPNEQQVFIGWWKIE